MPVTLATHAMGTRFELVLAGGDPHRLRAVGEMALREIEECHQRFNLFDPCSWLNTISRHAVDEPVALDDLTFELFEACQEVHRESGGAFDITVAPLMHALGLHRPAGPVDHAKILKAQARVGMHQVQLDHDAKTIRFTKPGIELDLGAVAKGFAIDLAIELLREHGITCALLHGGTSTAAAIGSPPGEDGWRIKVRGGVSDQAREQAISVSLKDAALSVSAPHGRTIESAGETIGHVLDPRTGTPACCATFAAAISESACLADAWSTALLVLGKQPATMPRNIQAILPNHTATASDPIIDHPTTDPTPRTHPGISPRIQHRPTLMEGVTL
jgi:thiamine biosynthesis lipoprotein